MWAALSLAIFHASLALAAPTGSSFQFIIEPASTSGCVQLSYATASEGFPKSTSNIRFYYSAGDAASVTESSPSFVTTVKYDPKGNMSLTPIKFCGLAQTHYSFKYGLTDKAGSLLEFMAESEFNPDTNGVDVP